MTRFATLALTVVAALLAPATVQASQNFGSLLKNSPANGPNPCVDTMPGPCTLVAYINPNDAGDPVTSPAPIDGVVVKVRVRSTAAESVTFRFATITLQGGGAQARSAAVGPTVTLAGTGAIEEFPARVSVRKGAHVALDAPSASMVYNQGGNEFTYLFAPPLEQGQALRSSSGQPTGELLVQAVIEPDADRDGFGDESQDGCPANPDATAAPCDDVTRPRLTGARLQSKAFRRSTVLDYRLSEAGTLTVRVEKATRGRRVRGKCRKPSARTARAKRCTRYVKVRGKLTDQSRSGANEVRIKRRFAGRRLAPGAYRLVLRARDVAGNRSAVKRVKFRIRR